MRASAQEQGLVAAQLAGLRQHGLSTPEALRVVLPNLRAPLAREAESLALALEGGSAPSPSTSPLLRLLAGETQASPEESAASLREVAQGFAVVTEAELAWDQVIRPWLIGGTGLLLFLCGTAWSFQALPGQADRAVGLSETGWLFLGAMRWLGVPLAVLWVLAIRVSSRWLSSVITRPFLVAATLRGLGASRAKQGDGLGDEPELAASSARWTPAERAAFRLLRVRYGVQVAAPALAAELEREGRLAAARTTAISTLLCVACILVVLAQLAPILFLPIFSVASPVQ